MLFFFLKLQQQISILNQVQKISKQTSSPYWGPPVQWGRREMNCNTNHWSKSFFDQNSGWRYIFWQAFAVEDGRWEAWNDPQKRDRPNITLHTIYIEWSIFTNQLHWHINVQVISFFYILGLNHLSWCVLWKPPWVWIPFSCHPPFRKSYDKGFFDPVFSSIVQRMHTRDKKLQCSNKSFPDRLRDNSVSNNNWNFGHLPMRWNSSFVLDCL